ncbi:MAG: PD-(D/E)XK nuclease family protein [Deltaproteobacteria bacterium]|nr:PD-(D/E)XK nuclease family protein [Deltaproteobacteria bacterium]
MTSPKPLAELRALPHLSVSQLKTFIQCPRKYALAYVHGVAPQFRPIALAFGTAWHEAVGFHLTASTKAQQAERNEVKTIFRERLSIAVEGDATPVLFDDDEDLGKVIDHGIKMLDVFLDRLPIPERVIGVELPFSLEIVDPEFGDVLEVPLIGALDALVIHDGRPAVLELKTAKKKWSTDQLEYDLQPTAYAMAAEQLGYDNPDVVLLVATKTSKPDVQIERLVRTKADRDDLAVTAQSVTAAIAAGIDHPIRGWACRGCPYAHACR